MSFNIKSFSWKPVGTYGTNATKGTKIDIKVEFDVTKSIRLMRQIEAVDGRQVMDYYYPPDQPITSPGAYTYQETNYAHVPFLLGFNPVGHIYKIAWEYVDVETNMSLSIQTQARAFCLREMVFDGILGAGAVLGSIAGALRFKKH